MQGRDRSISNKQLPAPPIYVTKHIHMLRGPAAKLWMENCGRVAERSDYRPKAPCCPCAIAAFCSWKRSPRRWDPFMCLSTHRMMQPSSREVSDLLSKPLTQLSKHCWTRLEYIWTRRQHSAASRQERCGRTVMNSFICFFSMRFCSSRCSVGESLAGN